MAKFIVAFLVCGLLLGVSALPNRARNPGKSFETMIVGGKPVAQGELPYQISLERFGYHICGGSFAVIKGTHVVITAAHCLEQSLAQYYTVVAGDIKRSDTTGREQRRQVTRIIIHENYDRWTLFNDIAILLLDKPFDMNDDIKPIDLPTQGQVTTGQVIVSGWGALFQGGPLSDVLQMVQIPVVDDATCQRLYPQGTILKSMLCAGLVEEGGKDSCQNDSGGPLRSVSGGYLAGIVSWGYGCAAPGYPGVYTEVAYFRNWLEAQIPNY